MYKAKWQELLSKHTSAHTTTERLQKDLQQLQQSYADLQRVNHALESRLLGHHSPTAGQSPAKGNSPVYGSPVRQPYNSFGRLDADTAGQISYELDAQQRTGQDCWRGTRNLDRVLAELKGRASSGLGQAFDHSDMTAEDLESDALTQLSGGVSSEDIMARLTRSPEGAAGTLHAIVPPSYFVLSASICSMFVMTCLGCTS